MGKIDTEAKADLSNKERFSDIFNFRTKSQRQVLGRMPKHP